MPWRSISEVTGVRASEFAAEIDIFFEDLAKIAGSTVLPYFRTALHVEDKGGANFDPVTAADRAAEQALRTAIIRRYPTHSIVGEEFGESVGTSKFKWIIDPIDGTRSFISGIPLWGTLIALCDGTTPLFGMMSQAYIGERYVGGSGEATWYRGSERCVLHTRATNVLGAATLFATSPEMFEPSVEAPAFRRLANRVRLTRYGADCYAYCALAAGHVDLVVEAGLGIYDIAALIPIVEGAGGVVTDWHGEPVTGGGRVIAAANHELHALAIKVLSLE